MPFQYARRGCDNTHTAGAGIVACSSGDPSSAPLPEISESDSPVITDATTSPEGVAANKLGYRIHERTDGLGLIIVW